MSEYIVKCNELTTVTPIGNKLQFPDYIDYNQEVVRCRDCKHYEDYGGCCHRRYQPMAVTPDGFCKWASRRES